MSEKYHTLLADPPWLERGAGKIKRGADRHYPLMKTLDIIEYLKAIPTAEDAHLYLWVTNNHLIDGLKVIESLGFRYITNLVWIKDSFGLGRYFRGQHELCLFAVRGKTLMKESSTNISTVVNAKKREHSRKPDIFYHIVERTSFPPFVEAFARNRRSGWDSLGNELPDDTQMRIEVEQ